MEHEICIQCGAEVRPEEAYHVTEEAVCPPCAETDTVVCSYCGERFGVKTTLGTVIPRCVRHAIPITIRAATNAAG